MARAILIIGLIALLLVGGHAALVGATRLEGAPARLAGSTCGACHGP
ncbi:hypothetical protein [Paracraurococcus lichenis]|uniref:Cytochrome C n=1 Tax=Paracraurococcus lichenis TaxID=3064888 RepID=A0ABT9DSK9_9PROT|nr:hypothetical protein [Paracraurococcus sp. LOR1-02]MDO9706882.1 hypothetical protein [Paracraurococcus sp. LOR1-02]